MPAPGTGAVWLGEAVSVQRPAPVERQWKGIEATEKLANSTNTKVVIIGSGKDGLPLILGSDK